MSDDARHRAVPGRAPARSIVKPGVIKAMMEAERQAALSPPEPQAAEAPSASTNFNRGISAESVAAGYLIGKGFRILARRFRSKAGEIDIIARDRSTLIFVEVKTRASLDDAAEAITPRQRARIIGTAEAFLAQNPLLSGLNMRFDAVLVAERGAPRHIPDAFRPD